MNMRAVYWAGFITIFLVVCTESTVPEIVIALLVMGVVPGSDMTIPPMMMLISYPVLFLIALWWISTQPFFIGERVSATARPTRMVVKKSHATKPKTVTARKNATAKRRPRAAV
jgi:hypothetical protein